MTIKELKELCLQKKAEGHTHVQLVAPSFPSKGFPRGELLCVNKVDGKIVKVKIFNIDKVLRALKKIEEEI